MNYFAEPEYTHVWKTNEHEFAVWSRFDLVDFVFVLGAHNLVDNPCVLVPNFEAAILDVHQKEILF